MTTACRMNGSTEDCKWGASGKRHPNPDRKMLSEQNEQPCSEQTWPGARCPTSLPEANSILGARCRSRGWTHAVDSTAGVWNPHITGDALGGW